MDLWSNQVLKVEKDSFSLSIILHIWNLGDRALSGAVLDPCGPRSRWRESSLSTSEILETLSIAAILIANAFKFVRFAM